MEWPKWKSELLNLFDEQTQIPLVQQLKDGTISENVLLFLNLGISPQRMHALATSINMIIKRNTKRDPPVFLTSEQLSACRTLADVVKLVGKSVEGPEEK